MPKETYNEWLSEKQYGICRLSILSIYREPVVGSGMTSQLLFGETYAISGVDKTGQWFYISGQNNAGTGWMLKDQHHEISASEHDHFNQAPLQVTTSLLSKVKWGKDTIHVLPGSQIHADEHEIFKWSESFSFEGESRPFAVKAGRKELTGLARLFMHAPYLSGGRSFFGLFGASWLHLVYKISGYVIPNYLSGLVESGHTVSLEEIQDGDIVIFGNALGLPHHLGLYCGEGQMMEVKGKVELNAFDPEKWSNQKNNSKENRVLHVKNYL